MVKILTTVCIPLGIRRAVQHTEDTLLMRQSCEWPLSYNSNRAFNCCRVSS